MRLLWRRKETDLPPLVEPLRRDEPIVFDEEEQWHVHRELARLDEEVLRGRYFSLHSDYKIL